jgi:hypothetical protein
MLATLRPVVLHPASLTACLQYILKHHGKPTTVIICSTRADFLAELQGTSRDIHREDPEEEMEDDTNQPEEATARAFLVPTLGLLAASHTVNVAFCPSLQALHAYLAVYPASKHCCSTEEPTRRKDEVPMLAILNPISLHNGYSTSFSAQGFSRLFASAVEAADRAKQRLILAEFQVSRRSRSGNEETLDNAQQDFPGYEHEERMDIELEGGDDLTGPDPVSVAQRGQDPWAQHVSILNVSTRKFSLGERAWVGRSVSIRSIAERWCTFEELTDDVKRERPVEL